ncbi:Uu.00g085800.m01.CDS01 [Anthostomella pinea]|uniref:leucine--tRNA ligase n=1 Tax=Anthostomella pinea TaxID=933095 RepID=A0AAI8YHF3_9PEZI|nr:Uu.00g085800.m01.CDS01 [Anthostomella pinea]
MFSASRKVAGQPRLCLRLAVRRPLPHRSYATTQLDLPALDEKWRKTWKNRENFDRRRLDALGNDPATLEAEPDKSTGQHLYILPMWPYPSGKLHLGHLRVYTIADVIARWRRLQGRNVLLPMGWDAFGLPAENAAIERGIDPAEWTRDNIACMKEQLGVMNASFEWSREIATCDPEFYKQTQRIFLLLLRNGLASQQEALVNWDPVDNTVLANEQVDSEGRSWRSGAKIEQRKLKQWFFHTTKYKEALLRDLEELGKDDAWPERVLIMQQNWLGLSKGANILFPTNIENVPSLQRVEIFTSRPETVFAAQFIALSPDSPAVQSLASRDPDLRDFLKRTKDTPGDTTEGYRLPNIKAHSPLHYLDGDIHLQFEHVPVYVAPYVRGDYETGAVMGVPAHDARDWAFWKRHHPEEPVKYAVTPDYKGFPPQQDRPYLEAGYMTHLALGYHQQRSDDVVDDLIRRMKAASNLAKPRPSWKIRDWLISRQRYWGTPIPIIHCSKCGPQPVPDDQLPVKLPKVDHHWAKGQTGNPLESATDWINTTCPSCLGPGKRDTDTMDTFVDSSWYYMKFADPHNSDFPISELAAKNRLPVDLYIGGVEHAILHLLYARFIHKAVMGITYPKRTVYTQKDADRKVKELEQERQRPHKDRRSNVGQKLTMKAIRAIGRNGLPDLVETPRDCSAEPFKRLITQGMVHGKTYVDPDTGRFLKPDEVDLSNPSKPIVLASGKPARVTYEKMSKSKHNGVDPTTFIAKYGADATRAHILFQAPVGEVLNWDEDKISGITRWMRRVYDHVQTLAATEDLAPESRKYLNAKNYFNRSPDALRRMTKTEAAQYAADVEVWRTTQNAIISVTTAFQKVYPLNTVISTLMGLTNTILEGRATSGFILHKATVRLLRMMAPITPAFAEECWSILPGTNKSIFDSNRWGWPAPDGSLWLLQTNRRKCAVQVNGKLKCVVEIPTRPSDLAEDKAYRQWLTQEIMETAEAQEKLSGPASNIRKATKMFVIRDGALVNYIVQEERGALMLD